MATYVALPDEIAINGKKYHVSGGVTLSVASLYPPKQITGDYNEDSEPLRSIHSWHDQRGGIGVDRWNGPEDDNRAWFSTCWLRNQNHLVLPPLLVESAASPATGLFAQSVGQLATTMYWVFTSTFKVYSTATGASWSALLATLGGLPPLGHKGISNGIVGGSKYLAFAYQSGYGYTADGAIWASSAVAATALAIWDSRLWGISAATGQLWYTFTPGSGEINDAICPMEQVNGAMDLFVAPDAAGEPILYAYSTNGLYAHDAANSRFIKVNADLPDGVYAGVWCAVWNGKIYITSYTNIMEYDPVAATVRFVGPTSGDSVPTAYIGYNLALVSSHRGLLFAIIALDGSTSTLFEWNGIGWQVLWQGAATTQFGNLLPYAAVGHTRVYLGGISTAKIAYLEYPPTANPKQNTSYAYAASAIHKYPWFDAGQNNVNKLLLEVRVACQDVTAGETVKVEIAYDWVEGAADVSYTTLGTIAAAGNNTTTVYQIGTSGAGLAFQAVRIKLTLSRGGTTTLSPDVSRVSLVYLKSLPTKYQVSCKLDLTKDYSGVSPKAQRAALITALELGPLVEVTYRNDTGGTRNFQCKIMRLDGIEKTGEAEDGIVDFMAVEV